jgi:hypothetical protein
MKKSSLGTIVTGASCALVMACAGGGGDTSSPLRTPGASSRTLSTAQNVGDAGDHVVNEGEVEVCKHGTDAQFEVTTDGGQPITFSIANGTCKIVALNKVQIVDQFNTVTVHEVSSPSSILASILKTDLGFIIDTQTDGPIVETTPNDPVTSIIVNGFHGTKLDYTNHGVAPICDFITFGRLIAYVNGKKVIVSGNIGGNQPGGGILSEFHVEANDVDNHVANVDTYGPITSGPLSGLTNSRISTGFAKNGVAVEVRMWDGGEPGKGTDLLYVKLNGVELLGPNGVFIDQGNMQYHSNCRGPG